MRAAAAKVSKLASTKVVEAVDTDERYTPEVVLDLVRQVAPIGLDPCTTKKNRTKARHFFTARQNGLEQDWSICPRGELVWINCPYSRGQLIQWATKVAWARGALSQLESIMLTPCDLGTKWAKVLIEHASALGGWRGRIAFVKPDGSYDQGAKQPSILWYFGHRPHRFDAVFRRHLNMVRS